MIRAGEKKHKGKEIPAGEVFAVDTSGALGVELLVPSSGSDSWTRLVLQQFERRGQCVHYTVGAQERR